ncbi:hypothetical protein HPP92_004288 [Vanilla planifolia]|uniref:Methyltransferase type 11 domain-containing protein n=1 Tax=Vanilla planifolia TaxID=51239 RepID=A0A835VHZ6_VANPL|nr:hypothetical protein HPP92_004288 [Vanilla planifolia]
MAVVICSIRVPPPLRCWPRFYTDFHWPGFFTGKRPLKDRIITRNAKSSNFSSSTSTILACPICYKPLMSRTDPELSSLYPHNEIYYDLTIASGLKDYSEPMTVATELFRNPLVSFLYERGWRQNFIWGGSLAQKERDFVMVRADISRLPFVANSIDAVHAGAALHCWPSPSTGVAEISRVLRPGGIFVASTFILDVFPPAVPVFEATREATTCICQNMNWRTCAEIKIIAFGGSRTVSITPKTRRRLRFLSSRQGLSPNTPDAGSRHPWAFRSAINVDTSRRLSKS